MRSNQGSKISEGLRRLKEIVEWFELQKEVDVEEGLKKVKEGAKIIKFLKYKIKEVENEFEEIKKSINDEN